MNLIHLETMNPIKLGVWGLGRIGAVHCQYFSAAREMYQLTAVCDQDRARVESMAGEHGCAGYLDAADFLADPDVELVIIATRSLDHVAHATRALAAGKRVLLEKPIAVTGDDLQKLRELDQEYPGMLFCGHNHRFEPAIERIREVIASGILGAVYLVKIRRHHNFRRRADWQALLSCGGGQLSCWGPHLIDHALQFIKGPVRDIWSHLTRVNTPGDADDHFKIILVGENGVVVDAEASDAVALPDAYCAVYGNRGSLVCADEKVLQLKYIDPGYVFTEITASAGLPPQTRGYGSEEAVPWLEKTVKVQPDTSMWEEVEIQMARHLYRAIRGNTPFPVSNAEAMEVVRITEVMKRQNPQFKWNQ
jgi:scyllo-inositol 2-dehydrogenase (NADP+)